MKSLLFPVVLRVRRRRMLQDLRSLQVKRVGPATFGLRPNVAGRQRKRVFTQSAVPLLRSKRTVPLLLCFLCFILRCRVAVMLPIRDAQEGGVNELPQRKRPGKMTGAEVARGKLCELVELGALLGTDVLGDGASCAEPASTRRVDGRGDLSFEQYA